MKFCLVILGRLKGDVERLCGTQDFREKPLCQKSLLKIHTPKVISKTVRVGVQKVGKVRPAFDAWLSQHGAPAAQLVKRLLAEIAVRAT